MMAVFISVPMSGKDDALVKRSVMLAKRAYCRRKGLSAKDVWFYDNLSGIQNAEKELGHKFVTDENPKPAIMYLSAALVALSYCDEAVFGKGWKEARGCIIEHEVCEKYEIPIMDLEEK